jgi:hypothetical protein
MRVEEVPEWIVVDASLGLKWVLIEEHSGRVVPLRSRPLDGSSVIAALAIARDLVHPIYDCCYLALAIEENLVAVTADRRFRAAVAQHPSLADRMLLLRDIVLH